MSSTRSKSRLNRPVATSGKFLNINTKEKNKSHLNPIQWLFFVINGKPMKSYLSGYSRSPFKGKLSCKFNRYTNTHTHKGNVKLILYVK